MVHNISGSHVMHFGDPIGRQSIIGYVGATGRPSETLLQRMALPQRTRRCGDATPWVTVSLSLLSDHTSE